MFNSEQKGDTRDVEVPVQKKETYGVNPEDIHGLDDTSPVRFWFKI